jgi:WD40 repeat protein
LICKLEGTATQPGHANKVFATKFNKEEENIVVTGGWDNNVIVWDIRGKAKKAEPKLILT